MKKQVNKINLYEYLFKNNIGKLKENIKTIDEMIKILQGKYEVNLYSDEKFTRKVIDNMIKKYGDEKDYINKEDIITFELKTKGNIYHVGFNRKNNGIYVEGNEWLRIHLIILRGLNKNELSNIFLVGEYLYYKETACLA
ncbi:hypothetical protein [Miniphocaeibacter massiliensis]|uniref:hypothetical protein n=1 Tax=Miniphocaeibacter massiliensis TaxID=2041841 RepID=UPI000C1C1771|nr:hypothetical protein [Miniphocaeibacter massiliensis]